jgi:hypothetical protein
MAPGKSVKNFLQSSYDHLGRQGIQYSDSQYKDIQHNDTQHSDTA